MPRQLTADIGLPESRKVGLFRELDFQPRFGVGRQTDGSQPQSIAVELDGMEHSGEFLVGAVGQPGEPAVGHLADGLAPIAQLNQPQAGPRDCPCVAVGPENAVGQANFQPPPLAADDDFVRA